MEELQEDSVPVEHGPSNASWWASNFEEKFRTVSLGSPGGTLTNRGSPRYTEQNVLSGLKASQILWNTGTLSEPIPSGFYSIIAEKRLKKLFDGLPSMDELQSLGAEGFKADVILVDFEKDRKLSMLKQLIVTLVKGLNSNPAAMIKKTADLVSDVYKRPIESPAKSVLEESSNMFEYHGVQMLGQIKHGSCHPRAILFKVLADSVGLESSLAVGLPNDGTVECPDSYKHMSVIVVLNSVEMLVDLMRFPGQLLPRSAKAILMTHISAAGESDSAENDSCDSPLEPNSPLYSLPDRMDPDSLEKDENLQFQKRFETSSSLRNMMLRSGTALDRKMSPEHPSFRARRPSMLSGDRKSFRGFADDLATSRYKSEGASSSDTRKMRRRSISITPEIGDDIVRAVRAMNETLKQNRLSRQQGDDVSFSHSPIEKIGGTGHRKNYEQLSPQKAISLPSSPMHDYRSQSMRSGLSQYVANTELVSTWNRILESPMFNNRPLLPYPEWNIDFSELTVGTRVGIGFFGEVFRGMWNGTDVAIKVFLEQDLTAENMEDFCNEITILSRLRHPNVILFLGACTKPPRLSMITEYMEMGSLYYLIHLSGQKTKLSWRKRLKMLRDICRGLMCLHRMKIVHRDLKTANCLVNKHWTVKICDFGLSRMITDSPIRDSSSAGTPEWMAPELIRNEPFNEKCDIFSLGVIIWELCTLNKPWDGVPPERVVYAVANEGSRLEIPEGPLSRLISDCWAEPHERPSCDEILSRLVDCEYSMC